MSLNSNPWSHLLRTLRLCAPVASILSCFFFCLSSSWLAARRRSRCSRSWSWDCPCLPSWCSWSSLSRSSSPSLCQTPSIFWSQACFEQTDLRFLEMDLRHRALAWVCWPGSLWWSLLLNQWFWSWWHTDRAEIQHLSMSKPFFWCSERNVSEWSQRAIWRWRPWRILAGHLSSHSSRWDWALLEQYSSLSY